MGDLIKKFGWYLLVGSVLVAIFRGAGSIDNIYPWAVKESKQFEHFIKDLTSRVDTKNMKPLKSILPAVTASPHN